MKVDLDTCVGCGGCVSGYDGDSECPVSAITVIGGKVHIDHERCVNCGMCADLCALGAITKE